MTQLHVKEHAATTLPETGWGPLAGLPGHPMMWVLIASELAVFGALIVAFGIAGALEPDLFAAGRARLMDGDEACKQLAYLVGELCFDNLLTFSKPGIAGAETYIFVADGNFGGTAAIGEMLLQSHAGDIHLLPAIPGSWSAGSYSGMRARGNVEVSAAWENGRLTEAAVYAKSPIKTRLRFGDRTVQVELAAGEWQSFDGQLLCTGSGERR